MTRAPCSAAGCNRPSRGRGMCTTHWQRWRKTIPASIDLRALKPTVADRFDEYLHRDGKGCLVWGGSLDTHGYGQFRIGSKSKLAHRFAWERVNGPIPEGMHIDHRCHNRACVDVQHLRLATRQENARHRQGATRANKSTGVRNVYPEKRGFRVMIGFEGKPRYFGIYPTIREAAEVADRSRRELFGEFEGRG